MAEVLTPMRRQILEFIVTCQRERSFPPTIREIGEHVGLSSSATVANHITRLKGRGVHREESSTAAHTDGSTRRG